MRLKSIVKLGLLSASLTTLLGCGGYSITGGPGRTVTPSLLSSSPRQDELLRVNSIAVLPIDFESNARSKILNQGWFNEKLAQAAKSELNMQVFTDPLQVGESHSTGRALERGIPLALKLGADAVLTTKVVNYVDRVGNEVAASAPAQVDFSMSLIRTKDKQEIWSANYHFKDQAVSENLFKLKQNLSKTKGPSWRGAGEVLVDGFSSACKDLAERRNSLFLAAP